MSTFSENAPSVCLFAENPNRLVSLLDLMLVVPIHDLLKELRSIWIHGSLATVTNIDYRNAQVKLMRECLLRLDKHCADVDLPMSRLHIKDALESIEHVLDPVVRTNADALDRMSQIISSNVEKEISLKMFFTVPHDAAQRYLNPLEHWKEVTTRWSALRLDIEESSKCFALERFAASIFHILLVAEFGVIQVANLMGVSGDKPGWGSVDRLQKILDKKYSDRLPLEQQHSAFLKDNVPMMIAVKDSWRHKISHVDNKLVWLDSDFSPQIASEIVGSTRGFMRRLAHDLP